MQGKRVLIVGASSGVGRSLGMQAAREGASVAFAARRVELVEQAASEAGNNSIGVHCDVRDEASCTALVEATVKAFGGLDTVVYSTAIDVLIKMTDATMSTWSDTFATNVFGAATITAAALPHIEASGGRFAYISASSIDRPLPGMGVYAASKGALEHMVLAWQAEHPTVAFANIRIGSTLPTGVADSWNRDLMIELSPIWSQFGYVHDNGPGGPMETDEATAAILEVLASPVWQRDITIVSDPARAPKS